MTNQNNATHFRFALLTITLLLLATASLPAQVTNSKHRQTDSFRQLDESLPTPTEARLASGAPGPEYWQQRADYVIDVEIDDENQRLIGREQITYRNQSPHQLKYIWLQLDANILHQIRTLC